MRLLPSLPVRRNSAPPPSYAIGQYVQRLVPLPDPAAHPALLTRLYLPLVRSSPAPPTGNLLRNGDFRQATPKWTTTQPELALAFGATFPAGDTTSSFALSEVSVTWLGPLDSDQGSLPTPTPAPTLTPSPTPTFPPPTPTQPLLSPTWTPVPCPPTLPCLDPTTVPLRTTAQSRAPPAVAGSADRVFPPCLPTLPLSLFFCAQSQRITISPG